MRKRGIAQNGGGSNKAARVAKSNGGVSDIGVSIL